MNYRIGDIIEIIHDNKLATAKIVSSDGFRKTVSVVLHDAEKKEGSNSWSNWSWRYSSYPKEVIKVEDIIRVVKRKRGKGYKKKYEMILIDKNGNITDK